MSAWRVAGSLDQLLGQLDAIAPLRSRASDGSIGDAAHAARSTASDHNPHYVLAGQPLVTARDFTHDPAAGLDGQRLADALRAGRDQRLKYVIWSRRIMAGAGGPSPWTWRPYAGVNPHTHHVHVSVVADPRCQLRTPWALPGLDAPPPARIPTVQEDDMPLTPQDAALVAEHVWGRLTRNAFGDTVRADQILVGTEDRAAKTQARLGELDTLVQQLATGGVDPAVIERAVRDALGHGLTVTSTVAPAP